jgi:CSLREA domain-containing protein
MKKITLLLLLVATALAVLLAATTTPAPALADTTFTVNTTADAPDGNVGDGVCARPGTTNVCTLRAAIEEANAFSGDDTIVIPANIGPNTGTIELDSVLKDLSITSNINIDGPGAGAMTLKPQPRVPEDPSSRGISRVFSIGSGAVVEIEGLSIKGGTPPAGQEGGGILNSGTLTLRNTTVSDNTTTNSGDGDQGLGGGIYTTGTLEVTNSTLSGNSGGGTGGGIDNVGTLTVTNSTLSGNSAFDGGGIFNGFGTLTVTNSTLSGNRAHRGGGIYNVGQTNLSNTIIANSPSGGNCFNVTDFGARIIDHGHNISSDNTCSFSAQGSSNSTDPKLEALANNGGPTLTHALLPDSPAINAIPNGTNGCATEITTDQRGVKRPQAGNCEIGSFEDKSPKVKRVVPAGDATGIAPGTNVSALFSEDMRPLSINANTFKLFRAGTTTPIAAQLSYAAATKKATLNPDANLQLGKRYKAVVTTGAKDLAANPLDQDQNPSNGNQPKVWFFTVRT